MIFDAERVLLAERKEDKTEEELIFQYYHAPKFLDRYEAILKLTNSETSGAKMVFKDAQKDAHWYIRGTALQSIDLSNPQTNLPLIQQLATNDPHSEIRSLAYDYLIEIEDASALAVCERTLQADSSYLVIGKALELISNIQPARAQALAKELENEDSDQIIDAIGRIYANSNDTKYLSFFEKKMSKVDGYATFSFFDNYSYLAVQTPIEKHAPVIDKLEQLALNMKQSPWRRLAAAKAINNFRNFYYEQSFSTNSDKERLENLVKELGERLEKIKAKETSPELKALYDQLTLMERP